jgi:hypothetical protein
MNSLYGRFGINPKSMITIICSKEESDLHVKKQGFMWRHALGEPPFVGQPFHCPADD